MENICVLLLMSWMCHVYGQDVNTTTTTAQTTTSVNETGNGNLKCAESYCLPASYDKLEVPFDENGLVKVSGKNSPNLGI